MPSKPFDPDCMGVLGSYATDIAVSRVEDIESGMRKAPEAFPDYIKAWESIEREKSKLIQKLGGDAFAPEPLVTAIIAYHSEVVFEVYKQAVLDGGRICHAFLTRELPTKEGAR